MKLKIFLALVGVVVIITSTIIFFTRSRHVSLSPRTEVPININKNPTTSVNEDNLNTTPKSLKKGIGMFGFGGKNNPLAIKALNSLNVSWYYTWSKDPIYGDTTNKFVPMVRNKDIKSSGLFEENVKYFETRGMSPFLLVTNEPDSKVGDNMTVEQLIPYYPRLDKVADQLSTPAFTDRGTALQGTFLAEAKKQNIKIDFIPIHLYGPPNVQDFLKKIDDTYVEYKMPIWITEMGVRDDSAYEGPSNKAPCARTSTCVNKYSEAEVLAFMKELLPELEKRPYVVRYAWFGAGGNNYFIDNEQIAISRIFEPDNITLTPLGEYYSKF